MHPGSLFQQGDKTALAALVAERGFALIVGVADGRPLAAQTPVLFDGRHLRFHLFRDNPLTQVLAAGGASVLAVVNGPDAYVSPDWYQLADQVPTWNYVSVELEGPVTALDAAGATAVLDALSAHFEATLAPKSPWTRHKMSPGRFEAMLGAIVAFEMTVERCEGVWKLSQNKRPEVISRVITALESKPDEAARAIAALMRQL